jgi:hypothetical protein
MQHASKVRAQGALIWSADHEEVGDEDWYRPNYAAANGGYSGGEFNNGCAGASPVHGFGRNPDGTDPWPISLVLTMASPCGAEPQSGARMFRFLEPQQQPDLYYKVWFYFPQTFTLTDPSTPWWIIMSWKSTATTPQRNDPFFNITIGNRANGNMFIYLYEAKPYDPSSSTSHGQTLIDLPVGQWFYIEAFYRSRGDETGQVTVWQGDDTSRVLLWDLEGVPTRYPDAEGGTVEWAVTNYGNGVEPLPAQFAIDDAEIRTP